LLIGKFIILIYIKQMAKSDGLRCFKVTDKNGKERKLWRDAHGKPVKAADVALLRGVDVKSLSCRGKKPTKIPSPNKSETLMHTTKDGQVLQKICSPVDSKGKILPKPKFLSTSGAMGKKLLREGSYLPLADCGKKFIRASSKREARVVTIRAPAVGRSNEYQQHQKAYMAAHKGEALPKVLWSRGAAAWSATHAPPAPRPKSATGDRWNEIKRMPGLTMTQKSALYKREKISGVRYTSPKFVSSFG